MNHIKKEFKSFMVIFVMLSIVVFGFFYNYQYDNLRRVADIDLKSVCQETNIVYIVGKEMREIMARKRFQELTAQANKDLEKLGDLGWYNNFRLEFIGKRAVRNSLEDRLEQCFKVEI